MPETSPPSTPGDEPTTQTGALSSPGPEAGGPSGPDYTSGANDPPAAPVPDPVPAKASGGWKPWAIAGVAAALIAVGAGFAIGRSTHKASTVDAGPITPGGVGVPTTGLPQSGGGGDATNPSGFGRAARGTITKINGTSITVQATDGSSTLVKTTPTTQVTEAVNGTAADVVSGDRIIVVGPVTGSSVAATRISDMGKLGDIRVGRRARTGATTGSIPNGTGPNGTGPNGTGPAGGRFPGGAAGGFSFGTVTSVNGSTITITTSTGLTGTGSPASGKTLTITTTSTTTVMVTKHRTIADLKVGDTVQAVGATASDGTVTAVLIRVGTLGGGFGGGGGGGFGGGGFGGPGGPGGPTTGGGTGNPGATTQTTI